MSQNVVIAEDEPLILRSLCFIVQKEGGRPVGVTDGLAALAECRATRPALVILDVMIPGLGGYDVCRELRRDPLTADLPILIVTALGQAEHEQMAAEAGATKYLRKPFDARQVRDLVIHYLTAAQG